ncbi:uncharacterized protein LOC132197339 [Neocloeon triangulifer]|uniref:uncharacterized protein LOC132197339 n=1 Tax=Neocloeon triangulifer TaxID=2078957 RepID=UPI00286F033E|nr:uncharacterized protein LOC132197339 [Neocloeon triangulifer]
MQYLIALCVFALALHQGVALECYVCASAGDNANCGDPFKPDSNMPTCNLPNGTNAVCVKSIVSLPLGESDLVTTARSCAPNLSGDPCAAIRTTINGQGGVVDHCSICSTSLCNGAPHSVAVSVTSLIGAVLLALRHAF